MDKLMEFRVKIASKNQLRHLLKQKKEVYSQLEDGHNADLEKELKDEINAIELELATYE